MTEERWQLEELLSQLEERISDETKFVFRTEDGAELEISDVRFEAAEDRVVVTLDFTL